MDKITENEIKNMLKERKALYGYKQAKKALKSGKAEYIIIASEGIPKEEFKDYLEFEGNLKQLGIICGKPFGISVLTILKEE